MQVSRVVVAKLLGIWLWSNRARCTIELTRCERSLIMVNWSEGRKLGWLL